MGGIGMRYDPAIHHRRSIRLKGYDYSSDGLYFVTLSTWKRKMFFWDLPCFEKNCWEAMAGNSSAISECVYWWIYHYAQSFARNYRHWWHDPDGRGWSGRSCACPYCPGHPTTPNSPSFGEDFGIGEAAAVPKMHQPLTGNGDLLFEIDDDIVIWVWHGFYFGFFPSFFGSSMSRTFSPKWRNDQQCVVGFENLLDFRGYNWKM